MNEVTMKISKSGLKRFMALFLSLCLCLTMVQMDVLAGTTDNDKVEEITLSATTLSLKVGEKANLTATVKMQTPGSGDQTPGVGDQTPDEGDQTPGTGDQTPDEGDQTSGNGVRSTGAAAVQVNWTSSNEKVATVTKQGETVQVSAVGEGSAIITASAGGKTATCTVTVTSAGGSHQPGGSDQSGTQKPDPISVTLNTASATVPKGKTVALTATVAPADANNTSVTWKSSDDKIASVSNTGVVTGKKAGQATITATTVNGKTATCKITVAAVTLNAKSTVIQVKKSSAAVKVATKYPANDKVDSYVSSNTKVATVNKKTGKVTGKKVGKATITVTMKSGATATFKVTVQKGKVVTKSLKFAAKNVTVVKGKKAALSVTRNPISATEKLSYTSSNKKVATVDKKGKVTGKAYGTAKITVKSKNGKKATCTVKVVPKVTLKKTKASIKVNGTTTIAVKSMIKGDKVKSYKSADSKIATVNKKGKVTGKKAVTTTITVTTKKGGTATFTVTVQ